MKDPSGRNRYSINPDCRSEDTTKKLTVAAAILPVAIGLVTRAGLQFIWLCFYQLGFE